MRPFAFHFRPAHLKICNARNAIVSEKWRRVRAGRKPSLTNAHHKERGRGSERGEGGIVFRFPPEENSPLELHERVCSMYYVVLVLNAATP